MKYTKHDGQIVEVKGCTTCPHKVDHSHDGKQLMRCEMKMKFADNKINKRAKKLVGNWMGPYHESCPLPSTPERIPFIEVVK